MQARRALKPGERHNDLTLSIHAELIPHGAPPEAIQRIAVALDRDTESGALRVMFQVEAVIARLRLPEPAAALRADGLWQHSCFEIFLRAGHAESYYEFNLAPSGAWAAYRFAGRRSGRSSPVMTAPRIECGREPGSLVMLATLALGELPDCARAASLQAGLAAVIEDEHGALSYWALAHRSPQPDFHDPAGFEIAVPGR